MPRAGGIGARSCQSSATRSTMERWVLRPVFTQPGDRHERAATGGLVVKITGFIGGSSAPAERTSCTGWIRRIWPSGIKPSGARRSGGWSIGGAGANRHARSLQEGAARAATAAVWNPLRVEMGCGVAGTEAVRYGRLSGRMRSDGRALSQRARWCVVMWHISRWPVNMRSGAVWSE